MVVDWNALHQILPPDPEATARQLRELRRELAGANALLRQIPAHVVTDSIRQANGLPALSLARPN